MSAFTQGTLSYTEREWPLFPVRAGDKVPAVSKADGGNGVHDATTEPAQIAAWGERYPDANIGLAAGVAFWVLDVDSKGFFAEEPDGADSLTALQGRFGPLPTTVRQYTGGMGWQFFFQADERIINRAKILPGLDTRSAGGYVVAPPSLHPSGRHYRWLAPPEETELAKAPEWLIALLEPVVEPERPPPRPVSTGNLSRYAETALDRACSAIASAGIGYQCDTLEHQAYGIGRLVGGRVIGRTQAEQALVTAGLGMRSGKARRPWTREEIQWRVERALNKGETRPRELEVRA